MRDACHFVPCARPPGEAVSGAGEGCAGEAGVEQGEGPAGCLSTEHCRLCAAST